MTYRDRLSYGGAQMLAIEIANWWRERGYPGIRTWVEPTPIRFPVDRPVYAVRSNMVNGKPPRCRVMSMVRAA